jgi:DNA-binding NarL/FixJ family response regulator
MFSALLVDDQATFRKLVRVVLEDTTRFTIAGEANNGVEGVALAGQLQPDLVVLDLSMPRMGGLEALPLIRDASPDSKIVVLTGLELRRVSPIASERGASACLAKGSAPDELVDTVLGVLDGGPRP